MQQQLFESASTKKSNSLTISKSGKKQLSKNQEAFNKLTKRIEKLQKDISKKQDQFDLAMKLYGGDFCTIRSTLTGQRRELIVALADNYNTKKLAKADQKQLKIIIRDHLQVFFMELGPVEPDIEIKKIFEMLQGDNYDETLEAEKKLAREGMVEELNKMKADLSGINLDDEYELAEKLHETRQKLFDQYTEGNNHGSNNKKEKRKTAKQLDAERLQQEETELKQKNIGTIYKQLAKLFHPDLEQDEERKLEKEILMKELTAAYEAKDLHALLTLELRWIHKENEHLESLTEEKLAVYLRILQEQAQDLEFEKEAIFKHPQYAILVEAFGWGVKSYPVKTVQQSITELEDKLENFKSNIVDFKSDFALRYIKQMIKQWKQMQMEDEEEDDYLDAEEMFRQMFRK